MGIIDIKIVTLCCGACQIEETEKLLDKGSAWSGSSWQDQVEFGKFTTKWNGGGSQEPELIEVRCKKCGNIASSKIDYSN
ncbi:MAG: hypothetical protein ACOYOE_14745 [Chlorobium sp.]